jgi:L-threonylcarbamoyladenylate synthase
LADIRRLRAFLKRGGVIAYATESCYGLGCDPSSRPAVRRILQLKGRPQSKGLILIGADKHQFSQYLAAIPADIAGALSDWWPGPNTLLLAASHRCPRWLRGRHDKLAVRVTAHQETARLCHMLGMALVSTSANRSGQRPLKTAAACTRCFGSRLLALAGRVGGRRLPSRIIDPESGQVFRP